MNFDEYQKEARKTAKYERLPGYEYVYPTLGLAGETGEVVEKIKRFFRKDKKPLEDVRGDLKKELGDILWYVSQIATEFDLSLGDIAKSNVEKLQGRVDRGTLHGSGDTR